MSKRRWHRIWLLAALAASIERPATAAAQTGDKVAAEVAFQQAEKHMAAGDYGKACPLYEESLRHEKAMSAEFKLGECYEQSGRLASAWSTFTEVADWAKREKETKREDYARKRVQAIEPRLPRLAIRVPGAVAALPGLRVERDGRAVGQPLWGEAVPVDAGAHQVAVMAEGKVRWSAPVEVREEGKTVTIEVPPLVAAPVTPPRPAAGNAGPVAAPKVGAEPSKGSGPVSGAGPATGADQPTPGKAQRIAGITVAAVGLAGVGVGVALGLVAKGQYDDVGSHCQGSVCDAEGLDATASARSLGNVATAVFIGGGVALAGGVVLWLTAPSASSGDAPAASAESQARLRLGVAPWAGGATLVAGGAW